jgi:DNA mismatch repair protein MLH1
MQVSLLNQEFIINTIQSAVESKLRNSNEARTFQEQVHFGNEAWN